MAKIAFIGAGSFGFTRTLVKDILTFPLLQDATIALMDIDPERLEMITRAVQRIVKEGNYPAKVVSTLDRRAALEGADAVLCTILSGGVDVWRYDIEIPKKFGVDINVGDTRGPAGIFRALRTIPTMLSICRDMEEVCPRAILLNYTNPMAMLCRAMQRQSSIEVSGLCHSVQGTAHMLARWIKAPMAEVDYVCAGINHQAFYLKFTWKGEDAYPLIRKAMKRREVYNEEQVRNEMFLALGYYVTESSGHNSEYNAWFRKRPDLIERYCTHSTGWNPGEYAYILKSYRQRGRDWKKKIIEWIEDPKPLDLRRGEEYAASIINARLGGTPFEFNGNVPNTGLITNLPTGVCVEVPVIVNRRGLNPLHVGALPAQLAAMVNTSVAIEEMAVEAALTGNAEGVFHAICYDPLTAAVLSLAEIRDLVKAMLKKNQAYLPQFKSIAL
ncbi:MAG: alpha-galactosidase [Lentisphaerae bacterium]|nr:alpha-galactosidase [Lentisphaerota bacterium]